MRLNHVNLCSTDVEALADTLVTHFGFRARCCAGPRTLMVILATNLGAGYT